MNPLHLDGLGQAALIQNKELSPQELVELSIKAIEEYNPQLNAVIHTLYDRARDQVQKGLPQGPFHGVPFLLKDGIQAIKGIPTGSGSSFLSLGKAPRTTELVRRYEAAGLVILGKTNLPEFGLMPTTEPRHYGPSHNPWDLNRTPGGSSGGSCAAVAARMVAMAHANDGGGSIRIPASCCGLFGLKPSRARNPIGPMFGELISGLVEEHIVSRSVRDSAAMLDATHGPDIGALYHAPVPEGSFLAETQKDPAKLRIGFTLQSPMGREIDSDCKEAVEIAIKLCEEQGHELVEISLPQLYSGSQLGQMFTLVWAAGGTSPLRLVERITGHKARPELVEPMTWALYQIAENASAMDYEMARLGLHRMARAMGKLFTEIDVWMSPTLGMPPVELGGIFKQNPENPLEPFKAASGFAPFTALFNVSGQPAASIPLHWNKAGLPIGIQIAAKYGDEATLFRLAAQMERAMPWIDKLPEICV